jgi:hypothetical protein
MGQQWLDMRIVEERERREREAATLAMLPTALGELHATVEECVRDFDRTFGPGAAEARLEGGRIHVEVRDQQGGKWVARPPVFISLIPELPGFLVEAGTETLRVEIGSVPGGHYYYRVGDDYITLDELTRLMLDKVLFPRLTR